MLKRRKKRKKRRRGKKRMRRRRILMMKMEKKKKMKTEKRMKRNQLRNSKEFWKEKHGDGFACDGNDESENDDESCLHHTDDDGRGDDH